MSDKRTTMLLPDEKGDPQRPGASLRAAARQSRLLLTVLAAAVALLLMVALWTAVSRGHSAGRPLPHAGTAMGAAGPRRVVDGVPVGYADSQAGAVAAAVNYELARSQPAFITDETVRHAVLTQIMASSALQAEITSDDSSANGAMRALGLTPAGQGSGGSTWVEHSAPLGIQATSYSPQVATINVWMAEIAGIVGDPTSVLPPSGSYTTYVLTLTWQHGDWRIASIASQPGPVPNPSSNQSPSSQQDWQQSGSFNPPPPVS
jgi:hypothetical protein